MKIILNTREIDLATDLTTLKNSIKKLLDELLFKLNTPFSNDAYTLNGFYASDTPAPNILLALNNEGKLPTSITGDSDTVDRFHASSIATPNTLLALDNNGKLPASITGDANTVDGFHASSIPAPNTLLALNNDSKLPTSITGDSDTVDGFHATNIATPNALLALNNDGKLPASITGDSDTLDGQHGNYYLNRANHTGIQPPSTISPQGSGSGLNADAVDGFHASSTAIPNSLLALNNNAKLPASITGDADTVDGFHAGNASGNLAVSNGTVCTNLNSDMVDSFHATNIPTTLSVVVSSNRGPFIIDGWNKTANNLTLYVDNVNGSDTTGNGSSSNPYATVAKALSELPIKLASYVIIVLKKSPISYGSIYLNGLVMEIFGSLTLQGEFNRLDSGTVGSFNNSVNDPIYGSLVTVAQVTDTTKNWTTNQFQYKLIRVYKGTTSYYRTICYNDATSIYCNQTFPVTFDNTWSYEILDWGSMCDHIQLDYNSGTINIQGLKISMTSNFYCAVFRRTSSFNVNNCLFEGYANGSYPTITSGETNLEIYNSVINANNTSFHAVLPTAGAPYCFINLQGCLVLNNSSTAVYNNYSFSRIYLSSGTRLYKGTSNPTYGVQFMSGILIGSAIYGKMLIDVGQTGIILTRGAYIQNSSNFVFGQNVTTKISSHFGLVDGAKLQAYDNFGVNIPNYNHENIHSRILCNGSFATRVSTVSANTTLGVDHHIVLVDASGGARTITLPNATTCAGRQYVIKKIDSSTNAVTITPQTGQTIDGQANISITAQYDYRRVVSNGANWFLF